MIKYLIIAFSIIIFFPGHQIKGQTGYSYYYRVYFSDKGAYDPADFPATDLLSERAIARRNKAGISVPDQKDIPVYAPYLDTVKSKGLALHCTSRWMNTALFKSVIPVDPAELMDLPGVEDIRIVKKPTGKSSSFSKTDLMPEYLMTDQYARPISMLNGLNLHNSGFEGSGILIAVLDAGFPNANIISSLNNLRNRKGVKGTYDFVLGKKNVYSYHEHGTIILSVLAGEIEGILQGTAPGADFLLLRTEDSYSEFPSEEDFWAAGAEFADSAGADIITSSLGYYSFDDPLMNYKYSDLDGNKAFVTRVADIAASKGIVVITSAGNERNKEWKYITAPADADSVLTVGAVDAGNLISAFSSAGPSADGRIKPDVSAMGVAVPGQGANSIIGSYNGTSLSCPVISGMAACLMQAVPEATGGEIVAVIRQSSDRFSNPDSLYGYGIPNMISALTMLQEVHLINPGEGSAAGPNPTRGEVEITFREPPGAICVEIFSATGAHIYSKEFKIFEGRSILISALNNHSQGLYFIRLKTKNGTFVHKIVKLSN